MKNELNDLIKLSKNTNINIFKKNRNNWVLRDKRIIVDECVKMKKRKLKKLSTNIKNLSLQENIKSNDLKKIHSQTLSDIDNLDTIIDIIKNDNKFDSDEKYIEVYSNY